MACAPSNTPHPPSLRSGTFSHKRRRGRLALTAPPIAKVGDWQRCEVQSFPFSPCGPVVQLCGRHGMSEGEVHWGGFSGLRVMSGRGLGAVARFRAQLWCDRCPAAHVEGNRGQQHLCSRLGQADIADHGQAHAPLPGSEGGFDSCPASSDEAVVMLKPGRQFGMVLVGAPCDAGLLALRPQPGAPRMRVVGGIGIDGRLVAAGSEHRPQPCR